MLSCGPIEVRSGRDLEEPNVAAAPFPSVPILVLKAALVPLASRLASCFFQVFERNCSDTCCSNVWHFVCLCNRCELLGSIHAVEKSCLIGEIAPH